MSARRRLPSRKPAASHVLAGACAASHDAQLWLWLGELALISSTKLNRRREV